MNIILGETPSLLLLINIHPQINSVSDFYMSVIQHKKCTEHPQKSVSRYLPNQTEIHCQNSTWFDYWHSF